MILFDISYYTLINRSIAKFDRNNYTGLLSYLQFCEFDICGFKHIMD